MKAWVLRLFIPYVLVQTLGFYFAKNSLQFSSPFAFIAFRFLIAAGFLIIFSRRILLTKWSVAIAAATFVSTLTWFIGLQYVSPGDSSVLSSTGPLFAIPFALAILSERASILEVAGALIGFFGVLVYSLTLTHGSLLEGAILTLISSATWALFSTLFRKTRNEDPATVVGSQYLLGSVPFVVLAFFYPGVQYSQPFFYVDLLFMAIPAGAVQLYLLNRMLQIEDVAKISTMAFAIPALTIIVQSFLISAIPSAISIAGALMMFVGVYVSYRSKQIVTPMTEKVS
jgi:drug/metabolite transporter (DMT)-like permease